MAAFATLKSLSDEKKYVSPYQILGEFIGYIIRADSLSNTYGYTTTSSVMWKSRTNGWTMSRTLAHRTKMSKKKRHSRLLDYADLQITLARTH